MINFSKGTQAISSNADFLYRTHFLPRLTSKISQNNGAPFMLKYGHNGIAHGKMYSRKQNDRD